MTVESEKDLQGLKRIGRIVGLALKEMARQVRPGMTTAELDSIGREFLHGYGARSAPQLAYHFPGTSCISLNDEAAHGIPGLRVIRPGDLVNIDLSAELDGYYADSAVTVVVPPVSELKGKLVRAAQAALEAGIAAAREGAPLNAIGRAAEAEARRGGFTIIRNLPGHGVGRALHEAPTVPGFYAPWLRQRLAHGMVFTIEPFLSTGAREVVESSDGWTLKTPDGSFSAQFEHTIVINRGHPVVVTAV